jgi:hypothetical protein
MAGRVSGLMPAEKLARIVLEREGKQMGFALSPDAPHDRAQLNAPMSC